MEISITDITDVEKEISIEASTVELLPHLEKAYLRYLPKLEIHGFRKGKAPLDLVKKLHGEAIEYESLNAIASDMYREVVRDRSIEPIGEPVLTDMDYQRGKHLKFKIKYEIKPVIALQDYRNIAVEKPVHVTTDAEVDDEILRIRKANSTRSDAATVADDEHVVTADIQQLDPSGAPLIGKKSTDASLYPAGGTLYKEIREALANAAAGSTVRVKFDAGEGAEKTTNHIDIQIKKIEKVIIPEFDDAFVAQITKGKTATAAEFRTKLREDIELYWKEQSERHVTNAIIAELVRRHEFAVPESLVAGVLQSLLEDLRSRQPNHTLPPDFDEARFREENRDYAAFQAKWYLLRSRLIEAEHLSVDDADYERLAAVEGERTGIEKERLIQFYKTSDAIGERILGDKLTHLLRSSAIVTEKVVTEQK